jgi:hypothetical protein
MNTKALAFAVTSMLVAGCGNKDCRPNTSLIEITYDSITVAADQIEVALSYQGESSPQISQLRHPSGATTGSIQIDFPKGYQAGRSLTVVVTALKGNLPLGSVTDTFSLMPNCTVRQLHLSATSITDLGIAQDDMLEASAGDMLPVDSDMIGPPPVDMSPSCGYGGQACCSGPFQACTTGLKCDTDSTCVANDLWFVGYTLGAGLMNHPVVFHFDGTNWTAGPAVASGAEVLAGWSDRPNDVWAITDKDVIFYPGGSSWSVCGQNPCNTPGVPLSSIFGFSANDLWFGGLNAVFHCDGATCTDSHNGITGSNWAFGGFWGTSSSDLWGASSTGASHWDGAKWTGYATIAARAIWGNATSDVWAVGDQLWHWDGTSWSPPYSVDGANSKPTIFSVSGSASDDVWAVGYTTSNAPLVYHWDGKKWSSTSIDANANNLINVWAVSRKEAYAVNNTSVYYRWDGMQWTGMTLPSSVNTQTGASLSAVFGSGRPHP